MFPNSIRVRLTFLFSMVVAFLLIGACGGLIIFAHRSAIGDLKRQLHFAKLKIIREMIKPNGEIDQDEMREDSYGFATEGISLVIYTKSGKLVTKYLSAREDPAVMKPPAWLVTSIISSRYNMIVGIRWSNTQKILDTKSRLLISFSLLVLIIATIGAWFLTGNTLSPIGELARQAGNVSADNLSIRLHAPSNDTEVVELVQTLNGLLGRIAQTASMRQRFYAAASHELRTPLQALSGHLELALNRPRSKEEYIQALEEAQTQSHRLTTLVRDLLLLNRMETSDLPEKETFSLNELCDGLLSTLEPMYTKRNITLETHYDRSTICTAPSSYAEMLIRNLLENAFRYSPEGSTVKVRLVKHGASAILEIENKSVSEQHSDIDRWTEPFYRHDAARTNDGGGNGLGLAICASISEACGWTLKLKAHKDTIVATVEIA